MTDKLESIVLGGGCFWCLDASFRLIEGVTEVVSGYAGGDKSDPSYMEVSSELTGHAEVVKISFDTAIITLQDILDIFFAMHDPTTLNRQSADVGTQYRSIILYETDAQKLVIDEVINQVQKLWDNPIVTEVKKLDNFYPAEDYHQDYFAKNPAAGYCQVVINPKLAKLRQKFSQKLKS